MRHIIGVLRFFLFLLGTIQQTTFLRCFKKKFDNMNNTHLTAQSLSFPILSITCYVHISFRTSFCKEEKELSRYNRTSALRRSLLNNYGIIHDKTLDWRNVRIPIKKIRIILCLTVKRNKSDSFPANPTAAQATAID
jgi:hypothetical protein